MTFARLNGVVALVEEEGAERSLELRGRLDRGADGKMVDGRRQVRRRFRLRLSHLPFEEARSLALLAIGYGHVFSFNGGINASTSIAPTLIGHGAHLLPGGGWDGDALVVRSGLAISFDAQLDDEWTVLLRFRDGTAAGSPWRYGVRTHDGREWIDEVEGVAGLASLVGVSPAGVVTLNGVRLDAVAADVTYDELVILPWRMADAHILDVMAWEQAWGQAPEVHLQGDVVESPLGIFVAGTAETADVLTRGSGRTLRGGLVGPFPRAPFSIDDDFLNNALQEDVDLVETTRPASLESLPLPVLYYPEGAAFVAGLVVQEVVSGFDLADPLNPQPFASGPDGYENSATAYAGTLNDRAFRLGTQGSANGTAGALTVACWFKPTSLIAQTLWSKWSESTGAREWRVQMAATGEVIVEVSNGTGTNREIYTSTNPLLALNTWSFISFDYSAARPALARVRLFVDGRPVALTPAAVGVFVSMNVLAGVLHVPGQANPTTGLTGQIAHWACWAARALLTEEQRIAYLLTKRGHPLRRA